MSHKSTMSGRCYCGAVKFRVGGDPVKVAHCHCENCRRHTGCAVVTSAGYKREQIAFTADRPCEFSADGSAYRGFCKECGSTISYRKAGSQYMFLYLGLFDEPNELKPGVHMMYSEKLKWLKVDEDLPKSDAFA